MAHVMHDATSTAAKADAPVSAGAQDDAPTSSTAISPIPKPGDPIPEEHVRKPLATGRPLGRENNLTRERRAFIELIVGKENSDEREEFAASLRRQFMDGTIAPAIATIILNHWLGPVKNAPISFEAKVEKVVRMIVDPGSQSQQVVEAGEVIDVTATGERK